MACFSPMIIIYLQLFLFFFFNDTATTEIYTLSLHDALPICTWVAPACRRGKKLVCSSAVWLSGAMARRSEEHTSELQSRPHLVCRLLLEKKKKAKEDTTSLRTATALDLTTGVEMPHSPSTWC